MKPSIIGRVLHSLGVQKMTAPPRTAQFAPLVARIVPEARIVKEAIPVAERVPGSRFFYPGMKTTRAVVGRGGKSFIPLIKRQEAGGKASFVSPFALPSRFIKRRLEGDTQEREQTISAKEFEEYLYFDQWLPVVSSNVWAIKYNNLTETLRVKFLNHGAEYDYPGVDVDMAYTFAWTTSKGRWVWENLRNPGWVYHFVQSDDGYTPRRAQVFSEKVQRRVESRMSRRAARRK